MSTFDVSLYEVGGCVRDDLLGIPTKDIDYTVIAPSFNEMERYLVYHGFNIFVRNPEYLTIRAHFPKNGLWDNAFGRDTRNLTADFVLARKECEYSDGRRPDFVEPGTLEDDLSRRDFTVNALAKDGSGNIIDLFNGQEDLAWRRLVAIGTAKERFTEDALRAVRALRFSLTKNFTPDDDIITALDSAWLPPMVAAVSKERRMDELDKMFKFNTLSTMSILQTLTPHLRAAILDGFRLTTTMKKSKR